MIQLIHESNLKFSPPKTKTLQTDNYSEQIYLDPKNPKKTFKNRHVKKNTRRSSSYKLNDQDISQKMKNT